MPLVAVRRQRNSQRSKAQERVNFHGFAGKRENPRRGFPFSHKAKILREPISKKGETINMAGYRIVRINDDIKRELAQLIPNLKDPRVRGLISITRVDTTPDLRYCKVYVSALDKGDVKDMVKGLKSASGYLRRELAKRMTLRYTPELIFTPDDSIDQGSRIIGILGDIEKEPPVGPSSDPAAHLPEAEDEV